jgi:hypothetical protein
VLFGLSSAIRKIVFFSPISSSHVRMLSLGGSHFLIDLPIFFSRLVLVLEKLALTITEKPTPIPTLSGNTCARGSPATVWLDFGTKNGSLPFRTKSDWKLPVNFFN